MTDVILNDDPNDFTDLDGRCARIFGLGGNDTLRGADGDDTLHGGSGVDVLDGGSGFDEVSYDTDEIEGGGGRITVNLVTGGAIDGFGNRDTLIGIEAASGSSLGDDFFGDAVDNLFSGLAGNDTIRGGDGFDEVSYAWDAFHGGTAGIDANLATRIVIDGFGATDWLRGIEGVVGTVFADRLTGDAADNRFTGLGGDDTIDGGDGIDTIVTSGIVDLEQGLGFACGSYFSVTSIENVVGSEDTDVFAGNTLANVLSGAGGLDHLFGMEGDDTLDGGTGDDQLYGGDGADLLIGGDGYDVARYDDVCSCGLVIDLSDPSANTGAAAGDVYDGIELIIASYGDDTLIGDAGDNAFYGGEGHDLLRGEAGADYLDGNEGDDTLVGGDGADELVGGDGFDYARYDDADHGNLTIRLDAPQANTGAAAGDTYSGIEGIAGGAGRDLIFGDTAANHLLGLDANDMIDGRSGSDTLEGGAGADVFRFSTALGAGNVDTVVDFEPGSDRIMLHSSIFAGIGPTLDAGEFGNTSAAPGRFIIYQQSTGYLFFDEGGAGVGAGPRHFASLTPGTVLGIDDFVMV